jgi:hypothetical protein
LDRAGGKVDQVKSRNPRQRIVLIDPTGAMHSIIEIKKYAD